MYKIIGADGKEYGPISVEQLRQWRSEGRVNAQTKVLAEGATDWKTIAEIAELGEAMPITPPSLPSFQPGATATGYARSGIAGSQRSRYCTHRDGGFGDRVLRLKWRVHPGRWRHDVQS